MEVAKEEEMSTFKKVWSKALCCKAHEKEKGVIQDM